MVLQLFLFEVLVKNLQFESTVVVPPRNDMKVVAKVGNVINLVIQLDKLTAVENDDSYNVGKSLLFPYAAEDMQIILKDTPFEFVVTNKLTALPMGSTKIPWPSEFLNMVEQSHKSCTYTPPVSTSDSFTLKNMDDKASGTVDLSIRLSCFGKGIQTEFKSIKEEPNLSKILFKNVNSPTMFHCQKCDPKADIAALYPNYSMITMYKAKFTERESISVNSSLVAKFDPKQSFLPPPITDQQRKTITITTKQEEVKYFDLRQVTMADDAETTADRLNLMLSNYCNCKDCPAAKKFKEYGIGPLASGKGLGTVYGPTDIPLSYGISQTYGIMETYGPYGVFTRPKVLEVPKEDDRCARSVASEGECDCCDCNDQNDGSDKEKKEPGDCPACAGLSGGCTILRLKGGGGGIDEEMIACKNLIHDFDKVVSAYRRALGPCGQTTCPFAPNVVDAKCQQRCTTDANILGQSTPNNLVSACGVPNCPKTRIQSNDVEAEFKNKQIKAACGSPVCPYTKHKIKLDEGDELMGAQLNRPFKPPSAVTDTCGGPTCPHYMPPKEPLEPIHWDCPDPLPKGLCKNPNCPLLPKLLKSFKPPPGPCGGRECPYAKPESCGKPGCPMGPPAPCPFAPKPPCPFEKKAKPCPFSPPKSETCDNPDCPYNIKEDDSICDNPDCPFAENLDDSNDICSNPDCPFAIKDDADDICDNPACPFAKKSPPCGKPPCPPPPCSPPPCPPSPSPPPPCGMPPCGIPPCMPINVCNIPNCPYSTPLPPCYAPPCPASPCPPPQCPPSPQYCPPPSEPCPIPSDDVCDNPDCPFVTKKASPCYVPQEESDACSNPACPFAKKPSPCAIPQSCPPSPCPPPPCPPPCPYLPPCGIPNCPYDFGMPPPPPPDFTPPKKTPSEKAKESESTKSDMNKSTNEKSSSEPALKQTEPPDMTETSKSENPISEGEVKKKKKKRRGKFAYKIGDKYPGVQCGHKECVIPGFPVPAKMGWLWNLPESGRLKTRRGWRPGIVARTIAARIEAHRKAKGCKLQEPLVAPKKRRGAGGEGYSTESESEEDTTPRPTLLIKKEKGSYYITMNPLKDPKTMAENENPYMNCTPMQFKITRNKDEGKTCFCNPDSESSESEIDIEFTPPAGIIRPERLQRKKPITHIETQYDPKDFTPPKEKGKKGKGGKGGKGKKGKKGKK